MKNQVIKLTITAFIYFLLNPISITAQTVIKMKNDGGVSVVPCRVNGIELQFIFDTGATNVSISSTEATFMLKNGFLKPEDLIGKSNYMDANGKISEGILINLKDFQIGDIKLNNVIASVSNNEIAPLLLGQSAIKKLGKIELDLKTNTIKIYSGNGFFDYSNKTGFGI